MAAGSRDFSPACRHLQRSRVRDSVGRRDRVRAATIPIAFRARAQSPLRARGRRPPVGAPRGPAAVAVAHLTASMIRSLSFSCKPWMAVNQACPASARARQRPCAGTHCLCHFSCSTSYVVVKAHPMTFLLGFSTKDFTNRTLADSSTKKSKSNCCFSLGSISTSVTSSVFPAT